MVTQLVIPAITRLDILVPCSSLDDVLKIAYTCTLQHIMTAQEKVNQVL